MVNPIRVSNPTQACEYLQSRRQKSPIGGALRLCRRPLHSKNCKKNCTDLQCFIFQFRGLEALFGGINAPNPHPNGDATEYR